MKIWLDDERPKPDGSWFHARNSYEAIRAMSVYKSAWEMLWKIYGKSGRGLVVEAISLDHDLGGDDTSREVVLWMAENDYWPENVYVHTANPVGREWLEGMVERYGPGVSVRNA